MSRPSTPPFGGRYLQVEAQPRTPFTTPVTAATRPFVPTQAHYKEQRAYAALMNKAYGQGAPSHFASVYVEGGDHLRAKIGFSLAHEVLVLDHLGNARAGDARYPKISDLVSYCLRVSGINPSEINFILIPNIANAATNNAIDKYKASEGWEPGLFLSPTTPAHRTPILTTDLGRTANSVAKKLGKQIGHIYVGNISNSPALGFSLVGSRGPTPPPAPGRPATPQRPAVPRAPTPVVQNKKNCGCIIC